MVRIMIIANGVNSGLTAFTPVQLWTQKNTGPRHKRPLMESFVTELVIVSFTVSVMAGEVLVE